MVVVVVVVHEAGFLVDDLLPLLGSRANNSVYRAHGGDIVLITDVVLEETVSDLPGEYARVLLLIVLDLGDHVGRGHLRLAAADHTRLNGAGFVVSEEDNRHD